MPGSSPGMTSGERTSIILAQLVGTKRQPSFAMEWYDGLPQRVKTMAPVIHPGRLLKREMVARNLSANRLSLDIGVPSGRITDILNFRRAITADTAVRLRRPFLNSAHTLLELA